MLKAIVMKLVATWEYEKWPSHQQCTANRARVIAIDYDRTVSEFLQIVSNLFR